MKAQRLLEPTIMAAVDDLMAGMNWNMLQSTFQLEFVFSIDSIYRYQDNLLIDICIMLLHATNRGWPNRQDSPLKATSDLQECPDKFEICTGEAPTEWWSLMFVPRRSPSEVRPEPGENPEFQRPCPTLPEALVEHAIMLFHGPLKFFWELLMMQQELSGHGIWDCRVLA